MYNFLALVQDDPTVQVVNITESPMPNLCAGESGSGKLPVLSYCR